MLGGRPLPVMCTHIHTCTCTTLSSSPFLCLSPSLFLSHNSFYPSLSPLSLFLLCSLSPSPPSLSASLCALPSCGLTGLPVARPAGREGDIGRPSMSLSVSRPTFALSTGSRRVSVKHLVSLIQTSMAVQVCMCM